MDRECQRLTIRISAFVLMMIVNSIAQAKSIDYGSLEKLFNEPITTSVNGSPQRASEVPVEMDIITADDIRRSGARDIPGVLLHVVGINVQQWTNNQADVGIRGYNQVYNPRLLVMINGRQVYADFYSFVPWSTLPVELNEIRQIEVVQGPNSALFGYNAAGGVINIITYNPLYDDVNKVAFTVGTQADKEASVILTKKINNVALKVAAGGYYSNDFSTSQNPMDLGTRRGDYHREINIDLRTLLTDSIELDLEGTFSKAANSGELTNYTMLYSIYETKSLKSTLFADTHYGGIKATIYRNEISDNMYLQANTDPSVRARNQVTVGELEDLFKVGTNHIFRIAAAMRYNTMPTLSLTTPNGNIYYHDYSLGGMWNWKIKPNLSLTNAIRLDFLALARNGYQPLPLSNSFWNRSYTEPSFNSGLVWQVDPTNTLRFSISRGVQLPNLSELGGILNAVPPFGYFAGLPNLSPTSVTNYEIGWGRILSFINAQTEVTAYHEITRNVAALTGSNLFSAGIINAPTNVGRSDATGLTLAIKGTSQNNVRWGLSDTPEIVHDYFKPSLKTTGQDFQNTTPVNTLKGNIGWSHDLWELDSFAQYVSSFYSIQGDLFTLTYSPVRINNYFSIDGRVAYKIRKNTTLALSSRNITHSTQRQTSAPSVERQILLTLTVDI